MIFTNRGPHLAPFYDLICTQVYPDLAEKSAMRIGSENRPSWIHQKHWEKLGESIAIKSSLVLKTLKEMSVNIVPASQILSNDFKIIHGDCGILEKLIAVIEKRAGTI
jgi:serine/threonine-protein kinase HipA